MCLCMQLSLKQHTLNSGDDDLDCHHTCFSEEALLCHPNQLHCFLKGQNLDVHQDCAGMGVEVLQGFFQISLICD